MSGCWRPAISLRACRSLRPASSMIWAADRATAPNCYRAASPMPRSPASTRPRPCLRMRRCAFRRLGSSSRTSPTGRRRMSRTSFSPMLRFSSCLSITFYSRASPRHWRAAAYLRRKMPVTARESSHALMRMVAAEGPWSSRLVPIAKTQPLIASFEDYYEWLRPVASRIDMWMTTYVHTFDGPEGIADWFAGSALQPFLERLSDDERCAFLARYRDGLRTAYPAQSDGKVLLAYPRLFI